MSEITITNMPELKTVLANNKIEHRMDLRPATEFHPETEYCIFKIDSKEYWYKFEKQDQSYPLVNACVKAEEGFVAIADPTAPFTTKQVTPKAKEASITVTKDIAEISKQVMFKGFQRVKNFETIKRGKTTENERHALDRENSKLAAQLTAACESLDALQIQCDAKAEQKRLMQIKPKNAEEKANKEMQLEALIDILDRISLDNYNAYLAEKEAKRKHLEEAKAIKAKPIAASEVEAAVSKNLMAKTAITTPKSLTDQLKKKKINHAIVTYYATKDAPETKCIKYDTQHYAWNYIFEKQGKSFALTNIIRKEVK